MKRWLFSPAIDLTVFGGTAVVALALVLLGPHYGSTEPEWSWIVGVLLVDVAHVWSTAFVVYFDPAELRRRPLLYAGVPIACFAGGVVVYAFGGPLWFWRIVAYLAVFHFIRQQYGWVMLYRARNGERDKLGRWIDGAMIYAATLYPLIYWHAHLPRQFWWMKTGDFAIELPPWTATVAGYLYLAVIAAYLARAVTTGPVSWGKHLVVVTTAACWYVGIVATNSDYTFTVTNVFIHGIPYLALVYIYARNAAREEASAKGTTALLLGPAGSRGRGVIVFLATLWVIAYVEELIWDRTIWHDREWLFGSGGDAGDAAMFIVPLLAMPQLAHYVLDAVLWRRRSNPRLGRLL
ncbi:MAG: hypothetical protein H0T89_08435 [Deltaproteobacteria bacterium]|nr:hypothetical protein [Deltaproteobacteria bacterium]MDQ3297549.1 hypothetical protein [Myxococcota bacterium]